MTKITRTFTYKLALPNYENRDFSMSQEVECEPEDAERVSEQTYEFVKNEVLKSVNEYKKEIGLDKDKKVKEEALEFPTK